MQLLELTARYPEIGPPVAALAFKLGQPEIGERLVRLGEDGGGPAVEYYFVTANVARREQRWNDAIDAAASALRAFAAAPDDQRTAAEGSRLLHLLRLGFATLMFEIRDVRARPGFVDALRAGLPALEPLLGGDAFYRTLVAQTLWFDDPEQSEKEWDRAAELDDSELAWNARGTWYKEAERDRDKAEQAYRRGLQDNPNSALLLHNVAQVLVDKAQDGAELADRAKRQLLNQAEELIRTALRESPPRNRRHIHATRDRLYELRKALPRPPRRNDDDRRQGRNRRGRGDDARGRGRNDEGQRARDDDGSRGRRNDGGQRSRGSGDDGSRGRRRGGDGGRGRGDNDSRGRGDNDSRGRGEGDTRGRRGRNRDAEPSAQDKFLKQGKFSLGDVISQKLKEHESKE